MTVQKLDPDTFCCVVAHAPLVSIDLIAINKEGKVLLGRRINEPAKGYWFTTGGRVFKNEILAQAMQRIAKKELGLCSLPARPQFIGVFEHFYDTSIFEGVSTHYVNIAYRIGVSGLTGLPTDQHDDYRWFALEELLESADVHPYVKDYFSPTKGTIPQ
jgi:colanic acid biosynthesis protein WcaH